MAENFEDQQQLSEADQIRQSLRDAGADLRTFFASKGYAAYRRFMEAEAGRMRDEAIGADTLEKRETARATYLAFVRVSGLQEHLREFIFEK
jgi:hypothetical protein